RRHPDSMDRIERCPRLVPRQCISHGGRRARRMEGRPIDSGVAQMTKLSHYDRGGSPRMVDVSGKTETRRTARAHAFVRMRPEVLHALPENPKGNPLEIARIAGISAA